MYRSTWQRHEAGECFESCVYCKQGKPKKVNKVNIDNLSGEESLGLIASILARRKRRKKNG